MRHARSAIAVSLLLFALLRESAAQTNAASVAATAARTRVVLVRDLSAVNGFSADAAKVGAMVAAGLKTLTRRPDEAAAWRALVSPEDVVGIKINTQAGALHTTSHAVVDAITQGLIAIGVPPRNIIVWDTDGAKMKAAAYATTQNTDKVRVSSAVPDTGWDEMVYFQNNIAGRLIWGDLEFNKGDEQLSNRSHLPKILTRTITKLINVPVLQDHAACGISGCLYNVSQGAVDNARRFELLGQRGDPMIAEIANMPQVRSKLVLNVMDALVGSYAAGPAFKPQYSWPYGGLYFSTDPVAVDTLCLELIEAKRRESSVPPISDQASHIRSAARIGLGNADRLQIELIEVKP